MNTPAVETLFDNFLDALEEAQHLDAKTGSWTAQTVGTHPERVRAWQRTRFLRDAVRSALVEIAPGARLRRQQEVHGWCTATFGADHAASLPQRGIRMVEEAIEAGQAAGCERAMVHQLVDHIFDKPVGELSQELGGIGVTLLALAQAAGLDADVCEVTEIRRVLSMPRDHFVARNAAKNAAGFDTLAEPQLQTSANPGSFAVTLQCLVEAARCLGSAQAAKDAGAVGYWNGEVARYTDALKPVQRAPSDIDESLQHSQLLNQFAWRLANALGEVPEGAQEAMIDLLPLLGRAVDVIEAGANDASVAAIQFALHGEEGLAFLRCWNEGDFDACRNGWPEAPEACYVGAEVGFTAASTESGPAYAAARSAHEETARE